MSQKSYEQTPAVYLVPTPIGNLEDITLRAISILKEVEVIFSEDTRVTSLLLNHLGITKKLIASHQHNEEQNREKLLSFLKQGNNVAIVTDRGTPIISDPGFFLTCVAIENGYAVIGLPGPTAFVPALIMSGISPQPFTFYGFLNSKESKRKKEVEELKYHKETLIFYEAPHRLEKSLQLFREVLGNRKISIAREISKKFEEVYRGSIDEILEIGVLPKGEFVIVVEGNHDNPDFSDITVQQHIQFYVKGGHSPNEAIKLVAKDRKQPKREIYQEYHKE